MANWSTDNYYFGRLFDPAAAEAARLEYAAKMSKAYGHEVNVAKSDLDSPWGYDYTNEQQYMIRALHFKPDEPNAGHGHVINRVEFVGPALRVSGNGRWGMGMPLTEESWKMLESGVVFYEGHDGFSDDWYRSIMINGEKVFEGKTSMYPEDNSPKAIDAPQTESTGWSWEGRTREEKHFFSRLFRAINDQRSVRALAQKLGGAS